MGIKDFNNSILVYTDGAASGNPGPAGWGAIVVFPSGIVMELGGKAGHATNNQMEVQAALEALWAIQRQIKKDPTLDHPIVVYTDSTYLIRGMTQWRFAWRRRGWKTAEGNEVVNRELWEELSRVSQTLKKIEWKYCRGHVGTAGNERVDEIATSFVKGKRPDLYQGNLLKYDVAVHDLPPDEGLPEQDFSKSKAEKKAAYSYLSEIGGEVVRHRDWKSCEARVKGRPRARFKKAMSAEQEEQILKSWKNNKITKITKIKDEGSDQ